MFAHEAIRSLGPRAAAAGLLVGLLALGAGRDAAADVIVLANRTGHELPLRFVPVSGPAQTPTLAPGENAPFYLDGKANVSFSSMGTSKAYLLDSNCAYFIGRRNDGRVELQKIGLGEDGTLIDGHTLPGNASTAPTRTITVKVLVDEEEPAKASVWERKLRRRVQAASDVLEKNFHTKLEVVAVGTWKSDDSTNDFFASLAEFEHKVDPAPAQLAIGFTSQWQMARGRMHMAGTRGPLNSHILVREGNPQINEPERLEFLIHELGHYLGAAHSPEHESIMRPVLGDKQAGRTNFKIQFDPVNTLAIAIISEEMRRRNLTRIGELSPDTRKRLGQIYVELARALPDDPAAYGFAQIVKSESGTPVVAAAHKVVKEISRAAMDNRTLPLPVGSADGPETRRQGDILTNYLVREAARAAQTQPEEVRLQAFLLGLAVGLNDNDLLAQMPGAGNVVAAIEDPGDRALRLTMLGEPTMRTRRDLARQFVLGALIASTSSVEAAQSAMIAKEFNDSQSPRGFSFPEIAAGRAGARFARAVLDKRVTLGMIEFAFSVPFYMPEVDGFPEKLSTTELAASYGNQGDPRFVQQIKLIDDRISQLPGYRPKGPTLKP